MAVSVNKDKCTGCAICVSICPMEAIDIKDGKAHVNDTCVECRVCISECPQGALFL